MLFRSKGPGTSYRIRYSTLEKFVRNEQVDHPTGYGWAGFPFVLTVEDGDVEELEDPQPTPVSASAAQITNEDSRRITLRDRANHVPPVGGRSRPLAGTRSRDRASQNA